MGSAMRSAAASACSPSNRRGAIPARSLASVVHRTAAFQSHDVLLIRVMTVRLYHRHHHRGNRSRQRPLAICCSSGPVCWEMLVLPQSHRRALIELRALGRRGVPRARRDVPGLTLERLALRTHCGPDGAA